MEYHRTDTFLFIMNQTKHRLFPPKKGEHIKQINFKSSFESETIFFLPR